jgi:NAD+ synthase (glutamine-hydrolysing)
MSEAYMTQNLRITLAQLNMSVGDIDKNLEKLICSSITARDEHGSDVIIFPELCLTGYPPEDLLLRPSFISDSNKALQKFIDGVRDIYCVVGHPYKTSDGLFNACSIIYNGHVLAVYAKRFLPNYGVFDERRYFIPGQKSCVLPIKNISVGFAICEDLWHEETISELAAKGARLILSPNASPFESNKHENRFDIISKQLQQHRLSLAYVNLVGGQDELIFDGGSMVINEEGKLTQFSGFFSENLLSVDIDNANTSTAMRADSITIPTKEERIYQALVLALRDYVTKNHIQGVILGVSGGIDSALTLAIAVDALGKDRVKAIIMPSRHTSVLSLEEAKAVTDNLDVETLTISIEPTYKAFLESIADGVPENRLGISAQNIQARCRAIILMSLSNSSQFLLLTTGNRSELAVGYCTLYGDMAGGYGVLKDIPKTLVYELATYRNSIASVIPQPTLTRPPTAELAPDQKDEDSLPPYSILDPILEAYLNHSLSVDEITALGFDRDIVVKVVNLIRQSEHKRRQAAIGPHINHKSFGKDWRYPICDGYKR